MLANAHPCDPDLSRLGGRLAVGYLVGLIVRRSRQHTRMGLDAIALLVLHLAGAAGAALSGSRAAVS